METKTTSTAPHGLRLLDLASLVAGFSLAGLLVRSLWPGPVVPTLAEALFLSFEFLWLGLAMGGPLVLLIDRRGEPADGSRPRYTRAELAWLLIGGYWIALTLLATPTKLPSGPLLGVLPVLAALALRLFGPRPDPAEATLPAWTHHVALALLWTWPLAWIALILLSKAML
ncbi:MAG: hypothetical protein ABI353_23915 [Isosphaeraceae bacterium]